MYKLVRWEVEVDADTPEEAAELARKMQLDPWSEATFFEVEDADGEWVDVQLDPLLSR